MGQCQCQETGDPADVNNDEHASVNKEVTETKAPNIEEVQADLTADFSEGTNIPRDKENSSKLPHDVEISCSESKSASENSEKEDKSSLQDTDNNEGANPNDRSSATENSEKEG